MSATPLERVLSWIEINAPLMMNALLPQTRRDQVMAYVAAGSPAEWPDSLIELHSTLNGQTTVSEYASLRLIPDYELLSLDSAIQLQSDLVAIRGPQPDDSSTLYNGYTKRQIEAAGHSLPTILVLEEEGRPPRIAENGFDSLTARERVKWEDDQWQILGQYLEVLRVPRTNQRRKVDPAIFQRSYFPLASWDGNALFVNLDTGSVHEWDDVEGVSANFSWESLDHFWLDLLKSLSEGAVLLYSVPSVHDGTLQWKFVDS